MNRAKLTAIAEETLTVINNGHYTAPSGVTHHIAADLRAAVAGTRLYRPADFPAVLTESLSNKLWPETITEVTGETTLAAAQRLTALDPNEAPLCLNFASAKGPGGGFLTGAQSQEESLARSSGLYATLAPQTEMYEHNRALSTCLYSDYMIYSPRVPVFRTDSGRWLEQPYLASFLTSPAVNAGAMQVNELTKLPLIRPTMAARLAKVLWVALQHKQTRLVLGAWGCGVFGNDPALIADLFAEALGPGGLFHRRFQHVVYAIYDHTPNRAVFAPFKRRLASTRSQ